MFSNFSEKILGVLLILDEIKYVILWFFVIVGTIGILWNIFQRTSRDNKTPEMISGIILNGLLILISLFLIYTDMTDIFNFIFS